MYLSPYRAWQKMRVISRRQLKTFVASALRSCPDTFSHFVVVAEERGGRYDLNLYLHRRQAPDADEHAPTIRDQCLRLGTVPNGQAPVPFVQDARAAFCATCYRYIPNLHVELTEFPF